MGIIAVFLSVIVALILIIYFLKKSSKTKNLNVDLDKIIIFDTETTGLNPSNDEILELSIINASGTILFNERIKPINRKRWPNAESIHGISPDDVENCKTIDAYREKIQNIFDNADVLVGYNIEFDKNFISSAGIKLSSKYTVDVMKDFADNRKIWDAKHNHNKWFKLEEAAKFYGYTFNAHHALDDTKATLFVFKKLNNLNN